MKRKIASFLLAATMLVSVFLSGCSNGSGGNAASEIAKTSESQTGTNTGADSTADSGEIVELVWQFPAPSDFGEGFYRMEDALNEMMEKDIGVRVRFEHTGFAEAATDATLMLSAGEQLDIFMSLGSAITSAIDSGLAIPLDDLFASHGQDIVEQSGPVLEKLRVKGQLYGTFPMGPTYGVFGYQMKKEFADKYGLVPEAGRAYTLEEMGAIFDTISEGEGGNTIMTVPWMHIKDPLNTNLGAFDKLGGETTWGVLMLDRAPEYHTTIVNLFETEEYAAYSKKMYEWAQKGYISSDATVTSDIPDDICKRSNVVGMFSYGVWDARLKQSPSWAKEVVIYDMVAPYMQGGTVDFMWQISSSCKNPEKAMEALNYLFKNKKANWLIMYGFEGEEYEVVETDGDNTLIRWLADDPADLPYFNPYGVWGNTLDLPVIEPQDILTNQIRRELSDNLPASRISPAVGYAFDSNSVSTEVAAINSVIVQYAPGINAGAVNPETALPEFINALKTAGMDKVIAENQRQFDEFLAQKK